jgi:RNA-directed DNA polymerase
MKRMRKLSALNIREVKHLCKHLGTNTTELDSICREIEKYYRQSIRNIKGKTRHISTPEGRLRKILDKLQVLLQRVCLPDCIHGGIKGYSYISNALPHVRKPAVLNLDLKDFFPNITNRRIYNLFVKRLGCTADMSSYLTKLTTLNGSLPQGSPTSTILAALASEPLAIRLKNLAEKNSADYTQYVDDITISGPKHIEFLIPTINKIIRQEGLIVNHDKTKVRNNSEEQTVTGIRVNQGFDAPKVKIKDIRERIDSITNKINIGIKPSNTELSSIKGKIQNIMQFNKGAAKSLRRRLNKSIKTGAVTDKCN